MDWGAIVVAPDGTHHVRNGVPLYSERYLEVLKYHAPGLAPAQTTEGATHIDVAGSPRYAARYRRTFGYYEGLAAVDDGEWFHIDAAGRRAYPAGWAWCGNMQGGRCAVRRADGRYLYIDAGGNPVGEASWRYVGDYKDGVGVVQGDDGLHTHIDVAGAAVHDRWFLDLDVFHKGFARARDASGWTHINPVGEPAYTRRFAGVEPYYNGQARVERFDGGLEVIDEGGTTLLELRPAHRTELAALSSDLVGFWRTRTIATAVTVGVFEALPAEVPEIAGRTGLASEGAGRLLSALAELCLVERGPEGWSATRRGALLRRDHPQTLADAALEYDGPMDQSWRRLGEALAANPSWRPPDVFREVAADAVRAASHHRMLRSYALDDYYELPGELGLRGDEAVLDVAGGTGTLAGLLLQAHPDLRLALLDLPEILALVPAELAARLELRDADLFGPWGAPVDLIVVSRVLHDWGDEDAGRILARARAALRPGGRLLVIETLACADRSAGGLLDLHLRVVTGGKCRTEEEHRALLSGAGLCLVAGRRVGPHLSVLEAVPC